MKRNEKKLNETERTQRREEEKKHTGVIWVLRSSARPQADGELKIKEQGFHTFFLGWDKIPF